MWVNGKRHRDGDFPAVENVNGTKEWWFNGQRHRLNDLLAVKMEINNGTLMESAIEHLIIFLHLITVDCLES